jgi:hypothetical protein
MNNQRWTVLFLAAVLFCLSELMPPWIYRCESGHGYPAGYHFFLKPPAPKAICISSDPLPAPLPAVFKNSLRLDAQRTVLISLTLGLLLVLRKPRTKPYVITGVLTLCVSAVSLLYLGLMIALGI